MSHDDLPTCTKDWAQTFCQNGMSSVVCASTRASGLDPVCGGFGGAGDVFRGWLSPDIHCARLRAAPNVHGEGTGLLFVPSKVLGHLPLNNRRQVAYRLGGSSR